MEFSFEESRFIERKKSPKEKKEGETVEDYEKIIKLAEAKEKRALYLLMF